MDDTSRRSLNEERLRKVYPPMAIKVRAILGDMEAHGWKPLIAINVWRTAAEQAQLVSEGKSKVLYSFHNVTNNDGSPCSLAADIYDVRTPYNEPNSFALQLRASARSHGLTTGAQFFKSNGAAKTALLDAAIDAKHWDSPVEIGWDRWHVQPVGITIAQAKAGQRP